MVTPSSATTDRPTTTGIVRAVPLYLWAGKQITQSSAVLRFSTSKRTAWIQADGGDEITVALPPHAIQMWAEYFESDASCTARTLVLLTAEPCNASLSGDHAEIIARPTRKVCWHLVSAKTSSYTVHRSNVIFRRSSRSALRLEFENDSMNIVLFDRYRVWLINPECAESGSRHAMDVEYGTSQFKLREIDRSRVDEADYNFLTLRNTVVSMEFASVVSSAREIFWLGSSEGSEKIPIALDDAQNGVRVFDECYGCIVVVDNGFEGAEVPVLVNGVNRRIVFHSGKASLN